VPAKVAIDNEIAVGHALTAIEEGAHDEHTLERLRKEWQLAGGKTPVIGITGTGGAGKSSVVDEMLLRFLHAFPQMRIAVLAVDPTRRRSGGALLGDRIRMNSLRSHRVFMRSMATRRQHAATSVMLKDCVAFLKGQGYDLVIVETAGIGQSDSEIVDLVDFPMYVMTSDYGAASQLEKSTCSTSPNSSCSTSSTSAAPKTRCATCASSGSATVSRSRRKTKTCRSTRPSRASSTIPASPGCLPTCAACCATNFRTLATRMWIGSRSSILRSRPRATVLIPGSRVRYLAEIAEQGRAINARIESQAEVADRAQSYWQSLRDLDDAKLPKALDLYETSALTEGDDRTLKTLRQRYNDAIQSLDSEALRLLREWPARLKSITDDVNEYEVRGKVIRVENYRESLAPEDPEDRRAELQELGRTARLPAKGKPARLLPVHRRRLSVPPHRRRPDPHVRGRGHARAHESPLPLPQPRPACRAPVDRVRQRHAYGEDPAPRPDIYGKIGNSGVNVPTLDDMKKLYSGFDLCAPTTSVSMTINGPAPIILAMFMNTAIDQQVEKYLKEDPACWAEAEKKIAKIFEGRGMDQQSRPRTTATSPRRTTASASACSASPATRSSTPRPTRRSRRPRFRPCAAPCRPTS
jgi:methylmalonyl-CoA mutase